MMPIVGFLTFNFVIERPDAFFIFSFYDSNHYDLVLNKDTITLTYWFNSLP